MAKTGNTGTISFGTTGLTASFTTIGEFALEVGELEVSHLGTSGNKEYIPDDLAAPGETPFDLWFDPTKALPAVGAAETITITFPKSVVGATAGSLAGTGWIKRIGTPEMKNGQVMVQKGVIKWDGVTGPTYTPQTGGSSSA